MLHGDTWSSLEALDATLLGRLLWAPGGRVFGPSGRATTARGRGAPAVPGAGFVMIEGWVPSSLQEELV